MLAFSYVDFSTRTIAVCEGTSISLPLMYLIGVRPASSLSAITTHSVSLARVLSNARETVALFSTSLFITTASLFHSPSVALETV